MPELPEVEAMCSYLHPLIQGFEIDSIEILKGSYLDNGAAVESLTGSVLSGVSRRAKYMLFHTHNGLVLAHNRFTGYWDVEESPWAFDYLEYNRHKLTKDIRMVWHLKFDERRLTMRFHDARLLAKVDFFQGEHCPWQLEHLKKLGPEVLVTPRMEASAPHDWTFGGLMVTCLKAKNLPIKQLLLDQHAQAGIGNIYACEVLWQVGINPYQPAKDVYIGQCQQLVDATRELMAKAISRKIEYKTFINIFRAKTCPRCGGAVPRGVIAGRGTYYCPKCQPMVTRPDLSWIPD